MCPRQIRSDISSDNSQAQYDNNPVHDHASSSFNPLMNQVYRVDDTSTNRDREAIPSRKAMMERAS
jgi:hypothetical protein